MKNLEDADTNKNVIIPLGWELRELVNIFEFKNGVNAGKESFGIGIKFINVMEIIHHNVITAKMVRGSVNITAQQAKNFVVHRGDVLFNRTSEITNEVGLAAVYLDKEEVVFGGFVIRGVPKDQTLINDFKKYCFRSEFVRKQIIKGGQGAVRSNIGQEDLKKVRLLIPPSWEQKVIANVLGLLDSAININNELVKQKESQKDWLMQNLLSGKKRLNGYSNPLKKVKLSVFAKQVSLINKANSNIIVLSCTKTKGLVPSLEYFKRQVYSDDISSYKIVERYHFAYATNHIEEGSIGYQINFDSGLVSPMYTVFKTDESINDDYLFLFLKSYKALCEYKARMKGSINRRGGLRWAEFSQIKIYIPCIEEQIAIAQILQTADKEILLLKSKSEKLKEQKKGMMQVLLTGKKRLKLH